MKIAIAGLGAIGRAVARQLGQGIPGMRLSAVAVGSRERAGAFLRDFPHAVPILDSSELPQVADVIVECAPAAAFRGIALPALQSGRKLVVSSVGALLLAPDIMDLAAAKGGQILVPTGALIGLDAVTAAAEGEIFKVQLTTRKPVDALLGAPYLTEQKIELRGIAGPVRIFQGSPQEAAKAFPANVNVAAALALAVGSTEHIRIEIWADPGLERNCHEIQVDSDSARMAMRIENIPSENPKTGRITALSVIALLRKLSSPIRVGT